MWQQALRSVKDAKGCQFLDHVLLHVCRSLWRGGLEEVGATLERIKGNNDGPFRVWWLPTGNLSLLPIHCAGPYNEKLGGLQDMCISSYTTSLSALIRGGAASASPSTATSPFSILAIAQPKVSGMPFLPCAISEVQELAVSPLANQVSVRIGEDATAEQVTKHLDQYDWLHCCCHGRWDPENPLDSAFRIPDGNMTLSTIIQKRLQRAQFAFLSACHTARNSALLPDESIHLAAGMQVAGYRGILATQWGMVDQDGPELVKLFYGFLAEKSIPPDPRHAAEALHRSLEVLRERGVPMFRWALFVHIGV
jgi:CHAT domain-containing protein